MRSTIALALVLAPLHVRAEAAALAQPATASSSPAVTRTPEVDAGASAPEDDRIARARQLYDEGEDRFATADYTGAIELWGRAFASLPDTTDTGRIKALLIYNLATAHERAYDISDELGHLRQARSLMQNYADSIPSLFVATAEADDERDKITARLNQIARKIDLAERARKRERRAGGDTDPADDDDARDRVAARRRATALLASGATLGALGIVGLAVMTGGLVMGRRANDIDDLADDDISGRRDRFARGRGGNTMAIVGGALGGVLVVSGAVLLGIGASARRKTVAWSPALAPGFAGAALRMRF
jgi:hypothetical protein